MMIYKFLTIICASSLPFLFSLHGDFVFDDSEAIVKNKDISSGSWEDLFNNDFWGTNIKSNLSHKSYRPLTILSFRLNYFLSGNRLIATHFKITNLICHVICCILVWLTYEIILNRIKQKRYWTDPAFLASIMFSVHPVHVEGICGIVGRSDILAATMFFLAFLSYHKVATNSMLKYIYLSITIILAAISMLFKENGITVLGFCLLCELIANVNINKLMKRLTWSKQNNKKDPTYKPQQESILKVSILFLSIVILLYGRWVVMGKTKPEFKFTDNPAAFAGNIFTKVATYNYIYFLNLLLLVWPQWLCYDWSMGCIPLIEKISDYRLLLVLCMYMYGILIIKSIFDRRNKEFIKRDIIYAVSLAVIPFLPAANIFYPVGFVIAERILYIPSSGYCLLVVIGLNKIMHKEGKTSKVVFVLYMFIILVYALRSYKRSFEWQNEYNLFISGLSICPLNAKVHYNVAKVADAKHQTSWALAEYQESIRLYPEYYQAMNNLANLLKNQKQFNEAEYYLRTAIRYKKDFPAAWMNLGIVLASTSRYQESQLAYKTALKYRNNYPDCLYNLGNLYLEINKTEDAIENWLQCINLNPKHNLAWTNLLALLDNTGEIDKALQIIPEAISSLPDSPSINFAIANIYGKMEDYIKAEEHFVKAINLFGDKVQAIHYANLGVLYHRWKKYGLAEEMYKKALQLNTMFKSAQKNLKSLLKLKSNKN